MEGPEIDRKPLLPARAAVRGTTAEVRGKNPRILREAKGVVKRGGAGQTLPDGAPGTRLPETPSGGYSNQPVTSRTTWVFPDGTLLWSETAPPAESPSTALFARV